MASPSGPTASSGSTCLPAKKPMPRVRPVSEVSGDGTRRPRSSRSACRLKAWLAPREDMRRLVSAEDKRFYDTFGSASGPTANIGFPWAQAPRRLGGDPKGHVMWVANWWGQNLAEIDIRTRAVTYHDAPIPYS